MLFYSLSIIGSRVLEFYLVSTMPLSIKFQIMHDGRKKKRQLCNFQTTKAQTDLGLRCPLTKFMHVVVCAEEQRMSRSDLTDSYADMDLLSGNCIRAFFVRCPSHRIVGS